MRIKIARILILAMLFAFTAGSVNAQVEATTSSVLEVEESPIPIPTVEPAPRPDITQKTEESVGPLEQLLANQKLGSVLPFNLIKYAIRSSIDAGVPANTIVLLLLLPLVTAIIAATRHIVGLRGFGIFLPASLAIVFLAIGPVLGISLFMVIVFVSTIARMSMRKVKIKLQYLPRMSLLLLLVVLGVLAVLFLAPILRYPDLTNVSIFPVLILVLLAEDFSKVQLGKSARTAINLAIETIILSLLTYAFLTMEPLRAFALLYPEALLILVFIANFILGKYTGLRVLEYWRYRKLIRS